ncbi:MAG: ribokinase [Ferrimicrobium sp.]
MKPIVVIGSINQDLIVRVAELPSPGETVLGSALEIRPGGKGANQAVAAALLGGRVFLVGMVGDDSTGRKMAAQIASKGVDISMITTASGKLTGMATILVDSHGENMIAVFSGANREVGDVHVQSAVETLAVQGGVAVLQMEVPEDAVMNAVEMLRGMEGVITVLNPSPVPTVSPEIFHGVDVLVVNEVEAGQLVGNTKTIESHSQALDAAAMIASFGISTVIITLGRLGAVMYDGGDAIAVEPPPVEAVDTTGAGDAFVGALSVGVSNGWTLERSFCFAVHASAIATTRPGTQDALPSTLDLVDRDMELPLIFQYSSSTGQSWKGEHRNVGC